MNRQVFSLVAPVVAKEFSFSNSGIALAINAFIAAYTFGQLLAGVFADAIGMRKAFAIAALIWSFTTIFTGLACGLWSFVGLRFLLGIAEAVNFPGGVKVIAEFFSPVERTTAVGLFSSGAAIGAIVTPPAVMFIMVHFGWRLAFVWIGVPGLLWVLFWLRHYPKAGELQGSLPQNLDVSKYDRPTGGRMPSFSLIERRAILGVSCARALEEPVAWFYFSWLALYLSSARHIPLSQIGTLLIVPFVTLDAGYMSGGWVASRLMKHGWNVDRVRKVVMVVSACCMTPSIFAPRAATTASFVCLISVATFGHGCWGANVFALPADLVTSERVGTVYGITSLSGGIGSILFVQLVGLLADHRHSFALAFVMVGLLPLLASIPIMLITIRQVENPVTSAPL
jgi:MFS transporter, ACS family, hexuronate transporter